jgi:hypothetical protein
MVVAFRSSAARVLYEACIGTTVTPWRRAVNPYVRKEVGMLRESPNLSGVMA